MQRAALLLLILAIGAGVYLFVSKTDSDSPEPPPVDVPPATPDPDDTGLKPPDRTKPIEVPTIFELDQPARVLMIARQHTTWSLTLEKSLKSLRNLQFRTWYLLNLRGGTDTAGIAGEGRGLPELTAKPTAQFLRDEAIEALIIDLADPNALSMEFWNAAAERVRSGSMGLLFRPGSNPMDDANQPLTAHQALSHPVLKELLPIASALNIEGEPVPGVFKKPQPLSPTKEGLEHPATRIVTDPESSRELWTRAGEGKGAWGVRFCYPVQDVKADATVLVNVAAGVPVPALIVSGGKGRVLWMGNVNFGDDETYRVAEKSRLRGVLLNNWWLWLLGRDPS